MLPQPTTPETFTPSTLPTTPSSEEVKKLIEENVRLKEQVSSLLERAKLVNQVVSADQVVALKKGSHRGVKWSSDSIVEGLSLKFTCGTTGYNQLRKKIPLPSTRTLRRSMQNGEFEPGVLEVVFSCLQNEVPKMKLIDQDCVIVLDEMAINPRLDFDRSSGCYIGGVTIPYGEPSECACKALVFMVNGLAKRFKQIVGYHFCGSKNNTDGTAEVLLEILKRCDDVGLNVLGIVCDMGNRAVLKKLGFRFNRDDMVYKIQNPVNAAKTLYVIPDFVHVFKSTKEMLCKTDQIILPGDVVTHHQLPSNVVNMTLVDWLEAEQSGSILKFAPKLKEEDIHANHFKKMKVSSSTNVIRPQVGGALVHMGKKLENPEMITTGWFIKKLRWWFSIVTSRNQGTALSLKNKQAYDEAIAVIELICKIFEMSDFGASWKVTQTHVIMSCKAVLEIQSDMLRRGYQYVCLGNLTQDSIENVFACVRIQRPKPSALDFKFRLKQFVFGRVAVRVANSSYTQDDAPSLISLLRTGKASSHPNPPTLEAATESCISFPELENCQDLGDEDKDILYRMSGYVLLKMKKEIKCEGCYEKLVHPENEPPHRHAGFTVETDIKSGSQVRVSSCLFELFVAVERMLVASLRFLPKMRPPDKIALAQHIVSRVQHLQLRTCHDVNSRLVGRYLSMRLSQLSTYVSKVMTPVTSAAFGSRSIGMRVLADRFTRSAKS